MPLAARVSLAAQRTIRDAFNDLERTISSEDSADFATTTLDKVIKAAHDVENQLAARQLLRNMRRLTPLFDGLQHYSKSIEAACEGTPNMAWIWAPIKLILKVSSDYVDAFDRIIGAYSRIAEPLARFKILHQTFDENVEVQQTFALFYSDILKFHKEAYKFVRRSGWKVFFMTSWGHFERRFDGIINDLKAHEKLVDSTANVVGLSQMKQMRENVEALRREAAEQVDRQEKERTAKQLLDLVGWLKVDNNQQANISDMITAELQKYPQTRDWILDQKRISTWMKCSMESTFLVLHGHPGTGKSALATRITAFLRSSGNSMVVSYICTYSQGASTDYDQIIRSILLQLIQHNSDLIAYIYEEFILKQKDVKAQVIESLILEVIGAISNNPSQTTYVHVVLDGLDECDKEKQPKVISLLERMVSKAFATTSTVCKVLVTSIMPPAISRKLKQKHCISLSGEKEKEALKKAIATYAAQRLGELKSKMDFKVSELKSLELQLATKADGMFLWARLVLNYLTNNMFVQKREVVEAVDALPHELSELYVKLRINDGVNVEELAPTYLFDMCMPLIEERSDTTFAFIHISVKDFLMSSKSTVCLDEFNQLQDQGLSIASCLLSGLQVFRPTYPSLDRRLRVLRGFHGLHVYASEYWAGYLLSIATSRKGLDTNSLFFRRSHKLSVVLNSFRQAKNPEILIQGLDHQICGLDSHPEIQAAVRAIESERIRKPVVSNHAADDLVIISGLSTLLFNYQNTVKELLQLFNHPRVTVQELEKFKQDFRCSAYTCSFSSCPLASTGFETEKLRNEHEMTHSPRVPCEVPGCQYPAFPSTSALKRHQAKEHAKGISKYRIRAPSQKTKSKNLSGSKRKAPINHYPHEKASHPDESDPDEFEIEAPTGMSMEFAVSDDVQNGDGWHAVSNPSADTKLDISLVRTLYPDSVVSCVRFSFDGLYLAVGSYEKAEVYTVARGELVAVLNNGNISGVQSMCFSSDSSCLVVGSEDMLVRVSKTDLTLMKLHPGCHADLTGLYRSSTLGQVGSSGPLKSIEALCIPSTFAGSATQEHSAMEMET
ncbi:NACHT domain-containing protein [Colletotrichum tamarilloi]|uniref:NACHT domain-containing protein n=1 Tax=Colletotrichum tamarilloi TaxID=1209934 RepID=A0ABQ9QNB6_9PEZI|nr:NACHT domain-containing protein [Colletotrichum tamarilloi]KAK1479161.1 NACHT domain-containing protein [Colletotrichum tamarilloi]